MYKKFLIIGLFLITTAIIYKKAGSCCQKSNTHVVEKKSFYLINVLDREEFLDAHIEQSIHVPFEEVPTFLNAIEDKSTPLIFYCANYFCTSSDEAALIAMKKGFSNVFVYQGGIAEWYQASKSDSSFLYNGPAQAEYLEIIILPKPEHEESIEEYSSDKTHKIKKISIKDLQKILKKGTMRE